LRSRNRLVTSTESQESKEDAPEYFAKRGSSPLTLGSKASFQNSSRTFPASKSEAPRITSKPASLRWHCSRSVSAAPLSARIQRLAISRSCSSLTPTPFLPPEISFGRAPPKPGCCPVEQVGICVRFYSDRH